MGEGGGGDGGGDGVGEGGGAGGGRVGGGGGSGRGERGHGGGGGCNGGPGGEHGGSGGHGSGDDSDDRSAAGDGETGGEGGGRGGSGGGGGFGWGRVPFGSIRGDAPAEDGPAAVSDVPCPDTGEGVASPPPPLLPKPRLIVTNSTAPSPMHASPSFSMRRSGEMATADADVELEVIVRPSRRTRLGIKKARIRPRRTLAGRRCPAVGSSARDAPAVDPISRASSKLPSGRRSIGLRICVVPLWCAMRRSSVASVSTRPGFARGPGASVCSIILVPVGRRRSWT